MKRKKPLDPAIADFVSSDSGDEMEVLVVLDTPQPDLSSVIGKNINWELAKPRLPGKDEVEHIVTRARKAFSNLGVEDAVWLPNVHSFVVELSGREMQALLELPEVLEITPNAKLE